MKKSLVIQILGVIATLLISFVFSHSELAKYDLQIVAVLFIIYYLAKRVFFNRAGFLFFEALLFVFIICSTVFSTGGVESPFFFLLYFLLFAVALILEPIVGLVLTISLVIMFLGLNNYSVAMKDWLPVLSLPFIAPFAKYLGDLQRKYFRQKEELKRMERAKEKSDSLQTYEKGQTLIFLTTVYRSHLDDLKERLENYMGDSDLEYIKNKVKELENLLENFKQYIEKIN